jgi:hypothetical protein
MEAGSHHRVHRVSGLCERDRNVEQELARRRIGDHGSLVTDHEIVELCLPEVRPYRAEHPPGDDHHVRTGGSRSRERLPGARPQHAVLGDQRPVEIEREGGDVRRKRGGERYGAVPPVETTT